MIYISICRFLYSYIHFSCVSQLSAYMSIVCASHCRFLRIIYGFTQSPLNITILISCGDTVMDHAVPYSYLHLRLDHSTVLCMASVNCPWVESILYVNTPRNTASHLHKRTHTNVHDDTDTHTFLPVTSQLLHHMILIFLSLILHSNILGTLIPLRIDRSMRWFTSGKKFYSPVAKK